MKTNKLYTRLVVLILSVASILALTACQSTIETKPDETISSVVETAPAETPETPVGTEAPEETPAEAPEETGTPEIIDTPSPDFDPLYYRRKPTTPEDELKKYGEIETLVKALVKATEITNDPAKINKTQYGTVNWNPAPQGYIEFTSAGAARLFFVQTPNNVTALVEVKDGETVKVALTGGTGKYQYGIGGGTAQTKNQVAYKNSFTVDATDTDLGPYLVSTAWGDYANAPKASEQASKLWDKDETQLENVKTIAKWPRKVLDYDKKLKQGPCATYIAPDSVIENGGGVCNEFSKLLSAMLRSQGVPAYYQIGESFVETSEAHAWVRAWIELENYEKDGKVYSKGAWITIEATTGEIDTKDHHEYHVISDAINYAN